MLKPFRLRLGNFQFFNGLEGGGEAVIETASSGVEGGKAHLHKVQVRSQIHLNKLSNRQ